MGAETTPPERTIVLADDVAELRFLLKTVLNTSDDFKVVAEAVMVQEAIERAAEHHPDVLLLDVSMPVKDGLEALPEIKAVSPETLVVILSGFEADTLGPAARAGGACGYLEKGLTPDELIQRLNEIIACQIDLRDQSAS